MVFFRSNKKRGMVAQALNLTRFLWGNLCSQLEKRDYLFDCGYFVFLAFFTGVWVCAELEQLPVAPGKTFPHWCGPFRGLRFRKEALL